MDLKMKRNLLANLPSKHVFVVNVYVGDAGEAPTFLQGEET